LQFPTLPGTAVEVVEEPPRARVRHALFDLDGTLSLLRDGWQDHMVPMMVEVLESASPTERREDLERLVIDFVDHLTGKQTIYQMIRLAEEVERRGGRPLDPLVYKQAYNRRLNDAIAGRLGGLRSGRDRPETYLLPGAKDFLDGLSRRGVRCYLASGTDVEYVRQDARLLGIERHFGDDIYGALPNYQDFSKENVIRKILADFNLSGPELLVVGDGFVEIQNARAVGAVAFGVFSRENNRYHMNADKRERLLRAGAQFLAPDLRDGEALLDHLAR
jgi:phosphoglycolate phosphatase-like HAD superfamily hydrolase